MTTSSVSWQRIRDILSPNPPTIAILDRITRHFGSRLEFYFQESTKQESSVRFRRASAQDELERIIVTIHTQPPAIIHECLHVKLAADGFPLLLGKKPTGPKAQFEFDSARSLENVLSHAVFLDQFLSFGFGRFDFATDVQKSENLPEFEKMIDGVLQNGLLTPIARGLWNRIYFEQLIADRMGMPNKRNGFLSLGRKRFPGMDADADWLSTWFDRGDFRNAVLFPSAVNQMLERIGLASVKWSRIEPVAGRLLLVDVP
ncbi:MAG: hypothetical protein ABSB42_00695 [Tepidisphaeraceae bacterium]|jgi:hypothetical protein